MNMVIVTLGLALSIQQTPAISQPARPIQTGQIPADAASQPATVEEPATQAAEKEPGAQPASQPQEDSAITAPEPVAAQALEAETKPTGTAEAYPCDPADCPTVVPCPEVAAVQNSGNKIEDTARPIIYGGAGVLGLGLLGSIIFASISLVEQVQAQDLLDNSPAFTKRDDKYLIRDSEHPDVGTYNALKSTANVLAQAGWISLGVGLSGGVAAGTAFLLNLEASE